MVAAESVSIHLQPVHDMLAEPGSDIADILSHLYMPEYLPVPEPFLWPTRHVLLQFLLRHNARNPVAPHLQAQFHIRQIAMPRTKSGHTDQNAYIHSHPWGNFTHRCLIHRYGQPYTADLAFTCTLSIRLQGPTNHSGYLVHRHHLVKKVQWSPKIFPSSR